MDATLANLVGMSIVGRLPGNGLVREHGDDALRALWADVAGSLLFEAMPQEDRDAARTRWGMRYIQNPTGPNAELTYAISKLLERWDEIAREFERSRGGYWALGTESAQMVLVWKTPKELVRVFAELAGDARPDYLAGIYAGLFQALGNGSVAARGGLVLLKDAVGIDAIDIAMKEYGFS